MASTIAYACMALVSTFALGVASAPQDGRDLSALQTAFAVRRSSGPVSTRAPLASAAASALSAEQVKADMLLRIRHLESTAMKQDRRLAELRKELLGDDGSRAEAPVAGAGSSWATRIAVLDHSLAVRTSSAEELLTSTRAAIARRAVELDAGQSCEARDAPACACA
mmetsp:Transcript_26029/g.69195  ORF Transcript_26029/g.69195 Transcript_26029/m.69195 type:complete len:167 (-) Transcript_26029:274-774(-)